MAKPRRQKLPIENSPNEEVVLDSLSTPFIEDLISQIESLILLYPQGKREVYLAVSDSIKYLGQVKSLIKFIEKAQKN